MNLALGWFFKLFNGGFTAGTGAYTRVVGACLRLSVPVLALYAGLLYLTYWSFTEIPVGFIPEQDKGYLLVNVQLPDSASVQRTREVTARLEKMARETPGVAHTVGIAGQSLVLDANAPNLGSLYVMLAEFDERRDPGKSGNAIAAHLRRRCREEIRDAVVTIFGAPPIDGLGTTGGFKIMIEDRGNLGLGDLQHVSDKIVDESNATPGLQGVFNSLRANTPWLHLEIDRTKCMALGVSTNDVFNTLQVYLGSYYVNNYNEFGRSWQVNVMADENFRNRVEQIKLLKVANHKGEMVPLGTVLTIGDTRSAR